MGWHLFCWFFISRAGANLIRLICAKCGRVYPLFSNPVSFCDCGHSFLKPSDPVPVVVNPIRTIPMPSISDVDKKENKEVVKDVR